MEVPITKNAMISQALSLFLYVAVSWLTVTPMINNYMSILLIIEGIASFCAAASVMYQLQHITWSALTLTQSNGSIPLSSPILSQQDQDTNSHEHDSSHFWSNLDDYSGALLHTLTSSQEMKNLSIVKDGKLYMEMEAAVGKSQYKHPSYNDPTN